MIFCRDLRLAGNSDWRLPSLVSQMASSTKWLILLGGRVTATSRETPLGMCKEFSS